MMEFEKKMRVTQDHWKIVVDFGEQHPEIITNRFSDHSQGKITQKRIWEELVNKLNLLGQGFSSVDEWKKTLADWKSKTKKKASQNTKEMSQTGGGPSGRVPLTELEERLLSLMGKTVTYGDNSASERGLKRGLHETLEVSNKNVEEMIFGDNVEVVYIPANSIPNDHLYAATPRPSEEPTPGPSKEPTSSGNNSSRPNQELIRSVGQSKTNKLPQKNKKSTEEMHEEVIGCLNDIVDNLASLETSMKNIALSLSSIAENTKQ